MRKTLFLALSLSLLSLPLFLVFARLDPEPHHDGVQFGAALALADGRLIHAEVFSQYGPVTAWIQGFLIEIFGPHLIVLRISTAILLSISVFVSICVGHQLRIPSWINGLAIASFVAMFPAWSIGGEFFALWPWPSVTFLVVALLGTGALLSQVGRPDPRVLVIAVAGALMGLGIMTRLNYGAPVALMATLSLLFIWWPNKRRVVLILTFVGAIVVAVLLILVPLALSKSVDYWFAQAILGPLGSSSAVFPQERFTYVLAYFFLAPIPFIVSIIVIIAMRGRLIARGLVPTLLVSAFIGLVLLSTSLAGAGTRLRVTILNLWDSQIVRSVLDVQPLAPLYAVTWLIPIVLLLWVFRSARSRRLVPTVSVLTSQEPAVHARTIVTASIALGMLAQLFPLFDPYHLWWAGPLGLLLLGQLVSRAFGDLRATILIGGLLFPSILVGLLNAGLESRTLRTTAEGVALQGMLIKVSAASNERAVAELLTQAVPGDTRVLCDDGLVSGWMGEYLPSTGSYVDWSWGMPEREDDERYIILCIEKSTTAEDLRILGEPTSSVIGRSPLLSLSPSSSFSLVLIDRRPNTPS